jgi:MFS family permease
MSRWTRFTIVPPDLETSVTDRIRSSRRLIIIGAALLVAAAVALVLGVIPPFRFDTFPGVDPDEASRSHMFQAGIAVLMALALAMVATRVTDRSRVLIGVLFVMGALVFLLGIPLAGIAPALLVHGPHLRTAIIIMFLCGVAHFAAAGLVVAAASCFPGPAMSEDTSAWKVRIAPAALFGIGSFFLTFLLGGVRFAANDTVARVVGGLVLAVFAGGYSLLVTYVLLRGLPRARRNLWIVLALNAVLLLTAPVVLIAEPGDFQGLEMLGIALISIACSYGGLALAARATRRRETG